MGSFHLRNRSPFITGHAALLCQSVERTQRLIGRPDFQLHSGQGEQGVLHLSTIVDNLG
jgi:hypothetical protein